MKNISLILSILFVSLTLSAQSNLNQLSNEQLAEHLLHENCTIGEDNALKTTLNSKKVQAVEPLLIEMYEKGPSQQALDEFEKASRQRYNMIQKALKSGRNYGLSEADLKLARKQTWENFYETEKKNYVQNRRSQALLALGRTGGEQAKKLLNTAAKNTQSPLHKSARQALKLMDRQ